MLFVCSAFNVLQNDMNSVPYLLGPVSSCQENKLENVLYLDMMDFKNLRTLEQGDIGPRQAHRY